MVNPVLDELELLETVLNNTASSIMLLKPVRNNTQTIIDFEYLFTNPQILRSMNRQSVAGKCLTEEFPGMAGSELLRAYINVIETGVNFQAEVHMAPLGTPGWAQLYARRAGDSLLVTYFDITDRKKADQLLRENEAWLNGQKEAFQAAMSGQPLVLSLEALAKTITNHTNGQARAAFYMVAPGGKGFQLVAGMPEAGSVDVNGFERGAGPGCWSLPVNIVGGPIIGTLAIYFQQRREPTPRETELAGIIAHAAAIIISLHKESLERSEVEAALRKSEERLKQTVRQKEEFISIASHELKTPVTSIKTYAEALLEIFEENSDEASAVYMHKLNNQVDRLTRLIKDLLDTSNISDGALQLFPEQFNLDELIAERIDEMKGISGIHKIILRAGSVGEVIADKERISQVLANLVGNAVKYSPSGGNVIVCTKGEEEHVIVSVEDNGIGIAAEAQQQLFERFFRVNSVKTRNFSGMGLGLYISLQIIRRHGGDMTVESKEGKGSVFSFTIPKSSIQT